MNLSRLTYEKSGNIFIICHFSLANHPRIVYNIFRIVNMWFYIKATLATDAKDKIVQYLGSYHGKVLVIIGIMVLIILIFTGKNIRKIYKSYHRNEIKRHVTFTTVNQNMLALYIGSVGGRSCT